MDILGVPLEQALAALTCITEVISVGLTGLGAHEGRLTAEQVEQIKRQLDSLGPQLASVSLMVQDVVDAQRITYGQLLGLVQVQQEIIQAQRQPDFDVAVWGHDPIGKPRPPAYYPLVDHGNRSKRVGTLFALNFRISNNGPRPVTVEEVSVLVQEGGESVCAQTPDHRVSAQLEKVSMGTALEHALRSTDYPKVAEGIEVFRIGLVTERSVGTPPQPLTATVRFSFLHGETREVACEFLCASAK